MAKLDRNSVEDQRAFVRKWLGSGSLIFHGPPFAGKDSMGKRVAKWLGDAPVLSSGEIMRNHRDLPDDVHKQLSAGHLAPTDFFLKAVAPCLAQPEFSGRPLVLSAVGRYPEEVKHIVAAAQRAHHPIRAVILLEIDKATVRQRWHKAFELGDRGYRIEDGEHAIDTRLAEFNDKTLRGLEFYRQRGLLITLDGRPSKDTVEASALAALVALASSASA